MIILASALSAQQSPPTVLDPVRTPFAGGYPGLVMIRVYVNAGGTITDAVFVRGPASVCNTVTRSDVIASRERALGLAREMKFQPGMSNGVPVPATYLVNIEFTDPNPKENKETILGTSDQPTGVKLAEPKIPSTISGGILNGKALSIPAPKYPAAARAVHVSGAVQVQVLIDEDGSVFSAATASGNPLLRSASETAACSARFAPTFLSGHPVKVSGIITYNFVP
jgi:outer membrane biosynthesis protein TonB